VRWWNVKHPSRYAQRLQAGALPVDGSETLTATDRHEEQVMLALRCREGLPSEALNDGESEAAARARASGLLRDDEERHVLTDRGRL
ncbi:coproporphyrinogen III oxidase, partial [Mycobacterium tuberculosis]|nr:coproporphyrinogen III oxidase [Mycobacterium tuberculosis]